MQEHFKTQRRKKLCRLKAMLCVRHTHTFSQPACVTHMHGKAWALEGNTQLSLAFSLFAHRLPLIYLIRQTGTTAEGTFILDRAICLLDIVDEEWRTDMSSLGQRSCSSCASWSSEYVRTEFDILICSRIVMIHLADYSVMYHITVFCSKSDWLWWTKLNRSTKFSQQDDFRFLFINF